jgi:hypothetical protein
VQMHVEHFGGSERVLQLFPAQCPGLAARWLWSQFGWRLGEPPGGSLTRGSSGWRQPQLRFANDRWARSRRQSPSSPLLPPSRPPVNLHRVEKPGVVRP